MRVSRAHPRRGRAGRIVGVAALVAVTAAACSNTPAADRRRPTPSTVSTAPSAPDLVLPPPPAGGFDPAVTVVFDGAPELTAEVARRPDQRARGLMQRRSLGATEGMLFLFPERGTGGFYMLGTLIPLSIAYVDGDRVVSTAEMTPCPGSDCPTYPAAAAYTMAVEANAGFFPRWGVRAGTKVRVIGETAAPE